MKIQNKRTDIVDHQRYAPEELIRFTVKKGKLRIPSSSYDGRGYYLKKEHLQLAVSRKIFCRYLKRELTKEEEERILAL